ncbi:aldo/keto reductase [Thermobifida cellulosilytica]|uniref:Oxidoreductase n=1 Tax=Thermobifida cellulosilytica TB100 TaxID=665004 RepID=A0A147KHW8_THECS|nr:aldo/keto reductase [Thermobifida cellulosilytica]KUP96873.1 oxidoreductase [Thermobifida cellulosilytica TB100]
MTIPVVTLNNGVTMPQLGFGTWRVGRDAVAEALRTGYRCIDTAEMYRNETDVAAALAGSGLERAEVFVTTKVWNDHHGHRATLEAFHASRRRLGLDVVDLYLVHWPSASDSVNVDTWRALESLHADGLVRAIGVSNFSPAQLDVLLDACDVVPAVNQIELHPARPRLEERAYHERHGIATQAWAPLARAAVLTHPVVTAVAAAHGRTPAQVVLRWHLQHGVIAIPRSASPERIRENFAVADFSLTPQDMAALDSLGGRTAP